MSRKPLAVGEGRPGWHQGSAELWKTWPPTQLPGGCGASRRRAALLHSGHSWLRSRTPHQPRPLQESRPHGLSATALPSARKRQVLPSCWSRRSGNRRSLAGRGPGGAVGRGRAGMQQGQARGATRARFSSASAGPLLTATGGRVVFQRREDRGRGTTGQWRRSLWAAQPGRAAQRPPRAGRRPTCSCPEARPPPPRA